MNIKLFSGLFFLIFLLSTKNSSAQKIYTEGVITYGLSGHPREIESKTYFKGDTAASINPASRVKIKIITAGLNDYMVVLVNVPFLSVKNAAILTRRDLADISKNEPVFEFTETNERKIINGFNCKKVLAQISGSKSTNEVWITKDVTAPVNNLNKYYVRLDGFPVQFVSKFLGKKLVVTVKSIAEEKVPADMFTIPSDYQIVHYDKLQGMSQGE